MRIKLTPSLMKSIILIESALILSLAVIIAILIVQHRAESDYLDGNVDGKDGKIHLLSSRIYADILAPKSNLILDFKPLQKGLEEYLIQNKLNASIYVLNLRSGASFGINEKYQFNPASLAKIPIAILILKKVEAGELSLDTGLRILPEHRDCRSGQLCDDSRNEISVKELIFHMLVNSDNTAYNTLTEEISLNDLQRLSAYTGYYDIYIHNSTKVNFRITPQSTANLFLSLYLSTILEPEHSEMILSMLTKTSFDIKRFAQLPDDVVVAQKYGIADHINDGAIELGNTIQFQDCGILYIDDSRIFYCVMIQNLKKQEDITTVFGAIVNSIYRYVVDTKQANEMI